MYNTLAPTGHRALLKDSMVKNEDQMWLIKSVAIL